MNIGDRVRLLHGREEGIVRNIIDEKTVEIEIEDGFLMPVFKREVVLIASEETHIFDKKEDKRVNESLVLSTEGIFLALQGYHDNQKLYFINNTDFELLFSFSALKESKIQGIVSGKLLPKQASQILQNLRWVELDKLPSYQLQIIYHHDSLHNPMDAFVKTIKLRAASLQNTKIIAPILKQEAYVMQIDAEIGNVKKIQEKITSNSEVKNSAYSKLKVEKEIDLHIEKLSNSYLTMTAFEMLSLQLDTFQKHLDNAIALQLSEIVFIHGIGNGTLKTEIHKRLSKNKQIAHYEDAQKEKFGYGATKVVIRK